MADRPQESSWGLWVILAVMSVLVGYPLSQGPALWIIENAVEGRQVERWVTRAYNVTYQPLWSLLKHSPEAVEDAALTYLHFWSRPQYPFGGRPL